MARVKKKRGKSANKSAIKSNSIHQKNIFKSYAFWILIAVLAIALIFIIFNNFQSPRFGPADDVLPLPGSGTAETPKNFVDSVVLLVNQVIDISTKAGSPLFSALLGEVTESGDLFPKILILFLVIIVTIAVLDNVEFFNGRIWLQIGVGSIISILGIRFLPEDFIEVITLPSGVFVAAITLFIPLALYFYVMEKFIPNMVIRKIGWVLFAVSTIVLWGYNYNKPFYWMYIIAFLICIILFFIDGTIQKWFYRSRAKVSLEKSTEKEVMILTAEIARLHTALATSTPATRPGIEKQINTASKNLTALTKSRLSP